MVAALRFSMCYTFYVYNLQSVSPCLRHVTHSTSIICQSLFTARYTFYVHNLSVPVTPISIIYNLSVPFYIYSVPSSSALCSIFFIWLSRLRFISHKNLPKFLNLWYLSKLVSILSLTSTVKHLWSFPTECTNVFPLILRIIGVCTPKQHYPIFENRITCYSLHIEFTPSKTYVNRW